MSYPSAYVQSLSDTVLTATASASINTSSSETKDGDGTVVDEERILSQAGDAKTESEDKSSYYHGSIKTSEAETRLKSHGEGSYLFRESGIKNQIFVLSTFSNGHIIVVSKFQTARGRISCKIIRRLQLWLRI